MLVGNGPRFGEALATEFWLPILNMSLNI
jgi:hypothetical protein